MIDDLEWNGELGFGVGSLFTSLSLYSRLTPGHVLELDGGR